MSKAKLLLEVAQIGLDLIGIVDPTGLADAASGIISLSKGRWLDAVISGASLIPYLGDIAKVGKFPRYMKVIRESIQFAKTDAKFAAALKDEFREISNLIAKIPMDKIPKSVSEPLQAMKREIDEFLQGVGNLLERQLANPGSRRFNPEYHDAGNLSLGTRKTPMDLSNSDAERLLKEAIPTQSGGSSSLWGYKDGKAYRFFFDNQSAWHGYPVSEKPPTDVLRKWLANRQITNAQYEKFVKTTQRGN
ncbi:MAG: hypothetical protein R3C59_14215 [Planctomycetaceae bacterium]